jgi:hypothetical protein
MAMVTRCDFLQEDKYGLEISITLLIKMLTSELSKLYQIPRERGRGFTEVWSVGSD